MSNFSEDLAVGKAAEVVFLNILKVRGNDVKLNESVDLEQLRKGDIIVNPDTDKEFYIEVKHDVMSSTTGNVCFESTTLNHTSSTGLAYLIDDKFYLWKTSYIKNKINNKEYKRKCRGGDNKHDLYLFSKDSITASADVIFEPDVTASTG